MTIDEIRELIKQVSFRNYIFEVLTKNGAMYLRAKYLEADVITGKEEWQFTRKWQLSEHMVKSEVVSTAFKCALTSAEHTTREHFLYKGERVYGPHFDVDALVEIAKARRLDYRGRTKRVG
jgi:hypothetical protein